MKTTKEWREHTKKIMAPGYISKSGYIRGGRVYSMVEFIRRLDARLPFYWRHKFMSAGFIEHWSFVQVRNAIKAGNLVCATKVKRN